MYRKYYSYSDMPQIKKTENAIRCENPPVPPPKPADSGNFLAKLGTDDVLIAVIILALLLDDNADNTLIFALAFVFLSGLI